MNAITLSEAVRTGRQHAREAVEAALAQADRSNALIRLDPTGALAAAEAVADRLARGESLPLAGVPVAIKDNLCWSGHETTCASRILAGFKPPYTATAVSRLLAAGAVVIGQANMDEFAMGSSNETSAYGPVRNPADPSRIPGGSSGGCAAAVAAGLVPLALGSDTGGSIRQPAALCGCVGLKPTYGRISRHGLIAFGSSLDQIGPLCSNVAEAALALQVMAGADPLDATSVDQPPVELPPTGPAAVADLAGKRIGFVPAHVEGLQPAVAAAVARAADRLRAAGAELIPLTLPRERFAVPCYYVIATAEASSNLSRYDGIHYGYRHPEATALDEVYSRSRAAGFGAEVQRRIMLGTFVLSAGYVDAYYKQAQRVRRLLADDFAAAFARCDCLLGPTSPTTAFRLGERLADPVQMYLSDIFTISANLAGLPAISLPAGKDEQGLPIGVQLQAPAWAETRLLRLAAGLEAVMQDLNR